MSWKYAWNSISSIWFSIKFFHEMYLFIIPSATAQFLNRNYLTSPKMEPVNPHNTYNWYRIYITVIEWSLRNWNDPKKSFALIACNSFSSSLHDTWNQKQFVGELSV